MTRHNDETHPLSTRHEARTGHNDTHPPRFRWSDEAHSEAYTRHTPTRHNGQHPFRGAPCRLSSPPIEISARFFPPLSKSAIARARREILLGRVPRRGEG
jgi:hypothetical protein